MIASLKNIPGFLCLVIILLVTGASSSSPQQSLNPGSNAQLLANEFLSQLQEKLQKEFSSTLHRNIVPHLTILDKPSKIKFEEAVREDLPQYLVHSFRPRALPIITNLLSESQHMSKDSREYSALASKTADQMKRSWQRHSSKTIEDWAQGWFEMNAPEVLSKADSSKSTHDVLPPSQPSSAKPRRNALAKRQVGGLQVVSVVGVISLTIAFLAAASIVSLSAMAFLTIVFIRAKPFFVHG
jgi:hypothetical protein